MDRAPSQPGPAARDRAADRPPSPSRPAARDRPIDRAPSHPNPGARDRRISRAGALADVVALVLAGTAGRAAADEPPDVPEVKSATAGRAAADEPPDVPELKSGATATGLAIGGTLAGFGLMALGGNAESEELGWIGLGVATVGPAAGHFYAGETGHGLVTSSVRAAGIAAFAVGFEMSFCLFECAQTEERRTGELLALGGLGLYAAATIYDVVDAHQAAQRANRRAARAAVAPTMLRMPDGQHAPGVVLGGRF